MDRVRFITHKGAEILFLDCSGRTATEIFPLIAHAKALIASRPKGSLLTLTDVTGAEINNALTRQAKAFTQHNKPYVKAAAVVGVEGAKQIVLGSLELASQREFRTFETLEEAKEWLAGLK